MTWPIRSRTSTRRWPSRSISGARPGGAEEDDGSAMLTRSAPGSVMANDMAINALACKDNVSEAAASSGRLRRFWHADRARWNLVLSQFADWSAASRKFFATVLRRDETGHIGSSRRPSAAGSRSRTCRSSPSSSTSTGDGRGQELIFPHQSRRDRDGRSRSSAARRDRIAGGPQPYLGVRNGLEARLARPVFYHLVEFGCEERIGDAVVFGVWSKQMFFPLGTIA